MTETTSAMLPDPLGDPLAEAGLPGAFRREAPATPPPVSAGAGEILRGGDEDDRLIGEAEDDQLDGGRGDDSLFGRGGADRLFGRDGDDLIRGDAGDDLLVGSGGQDLLVGGGGGDTLKGGGKEDTLKGGGGDDNLRGGGGDDVLRAGGGNDTLKGGGGDDNMKGGGGTDSLNGGGGNDTLNGGGRNDTLNGLGGDDTMIGGGGDDLLLAGAGSDLMRGSAGADTFRFTSADLAGGAIDVIADFTSGEDKLDLTGVAGIGGFGDLVFETFEGQLSIVIGGGRIVFANLTSAAQLSPDDVLPNDGGAGGGGGGTDGGGTVDDDTGGTVVVTPTGVREIRGTEGDDVLSGGEEDESLLGLGGDDKLGAGAGVDTLTGGAGADIYVIRLVDGGVDPDVDIVTDFDYVGGDRVGLTEILSGFAFDTLDERVRATPTDGDTVIAVKRDGDFEDALRLQGVTFTTEQLLAHGFTAPPRGDLTFVPNPYGFNNNSLATADPKTTRDGAYVVWVDQQNLDNDPLDFTVDASTDNTGELSATRDVFLLNTQTGALIRVADLSPTDPLIETVSPAVSADGRIVAYVQERSGTLTQNTTFGDVFVRDVSDPDAAPIKVNIAADGADGDAATPISNDQRGGLTNSRQNESLQVVDISGDGGRVAFVSGAQLSAADTNTTNDIYLRDLDAGTTTLVSVLDGAAGGNVQSEVKISEDGRYVLFTSSTDFTAGEGQVSSPFDSPDVYLFDTATNAILLVSSEVAGRAGSIDMSADGARIVFATDEAIAPDDTNGLRDIYVVDVDLGSFTVTSRQRVSEAEGKFQVVGGDSYAPTISHAGDRVAFVSQAEDLVPYRAEFIEDTGSFEERIYILDLGTGQLSAPDQPAATGPRESLITHVALAEDTFYYREVVDALVGTRFVSDSISTGELVAVESAPDTPDGQGFEIDSFASIRGVIDSPGDVDVYRIDAVSFSTRTLEVVVEGADSNNGTLADPFVTVFKTIGSDTFVITSDDNGGLATDDNSGFGRDAFTTFDRSTNGDRFIAVSSADGGTGSYRLRVQNEEGLDISPSLAPDDFIF